MQVFTLYASGQCAFAKHTITFETEEIVPLVPRKTAPIIAVRRATRETLAAKRQRIWYLGTVEHVYTHSVRFQHVLAAAFQEQSVVLRFPSN